MKKTALFFGLLLLVLAGVALASSGKPELMRTMVILSAVAAAAQIVAALLARPSSIDTPDAPPAETAKPAPAPLAPRAEAEIVSLLAVLQEKGRLVDFLMDDITKYEDAQVGAAARVVHQGCRTVLDEHFEIQPQQEAPEGSAVTVPTGHAADEYRLTGNLSGAAPFSGTLVHKGWKTTSVKLPRLIDGADPDRLPAIAPAEVEVK